MNSEELKSAASALKRLFNSFQPSGPVDVEAQSEAYLWAIKDYELVDIHAAVDRFIDGTVPGFTGFCCPSTAQLCPEIRERKNMREIIAKRDARLAGEAKLSLVRG